MAANITLPIVRYSCSEGRLGDRAFPPYENKTGSNIYLIVSEATRTLRVIAATTVLWDVIELGSRIDEAIDLQREASRLQAKRLPIYGVTRFETLAISYITFDQRIRRIQLRLETVAACSEVVALLRRLRMPFKDPPMQRARTAGRRPDSAASLLQYTMSQTESPYFEVPESRGRASNFNMPPVEAGSMSRQQPATGRGGQSWRPVIGDMSSDMHRAETQQSDFTSEIQVDRPPYSAECTWPAQAIESDLARRPSSVTFRSSTPAALPSDALGAVPSSSRIPPVVATLEQGIPPRHDLPFDRTNAHLPNVKRIQSRPGSTLDLPPLPRPKTSTVPYGNQGQVPTPASVAFPSKRSLADQQTQLEGLFNTSVSEQIGPSSSDLWNASDCGVKRAGPMSTLLHGGKRVLQERSPNPKMRRLDSTVDAEHELVSPRPRSIVPASRPAQDISASNARASDPVETLATTSDQLKLVEYAAQTPEDRQTALDNFMVANLENPAFATLCRDIENCWRRIALGL